LDYLKFNRVVSKMVEIIQISDLHYKNDFREDCMENIINYINKKKPDAVVCTGDIAHKGRVSEYNGICEYLRKIKPKLLVVPGNHDVKNNGLIFFEKCLGPRRRKMIIDEKDTIIIGLCSSRDDLKDGEIGDEQLLWLAQQFRKPRRENRIIALHHHLIPIPFAGRKWSTVRDAGELLEFTQLYEIDLVLQGHRHVPCVWEIGSTIFLYCGTSSADKTRSDESPSFNHIILEKKNLEINVVSSDTLEKKVLFTRINGKTTYIRRRATRIEHILEKVPIWD